MKNLVIVTATGKDIKMDAGFIYAFVLLFRLGSEARKVLTTFGLVFQPTLTQPGNLITDTLRGVSPG